LAHQPQLLAGKALPYVLAQDYAFANVMWERGEKIGPGGRVFNPFDCPGTHEQVRHVPVSKIVDYLQVGGGAEAFQYREDLVLFNQLADQIHRLGRGIGVILHQELDLPTVDSTLGLVDEIEIGFSCIWYQRINGYRAC